MADGTRKPIKDIRPGDKVLTTDPESGKITAEPVTDVINGSGTKHLVAITVDTDGANGSATGRLVATDGHPFWVPSLHEWVNASDLKPGMWLQTSTGSWTQITAIRAWTAHHRTVHNLTIDGTHTYYVGAGAQATLVHNMACSVLGRKVDVRDYRGKAGFNVLDLPDKGAGRYRWSRNKKWIDEAIERGDEIRIVGTDPTAPIYRGGNFLQREIRYLRDRGYTFRKVDDYWIAVLGR
jgi:hypothetical protein